MLQLIARRLSIIAILLLAVRVEAQTAVKITPDTAQPGIQIPSDFVGLSFETKLILPQEDGKHYFTADNKALIAMFKALGIRNLRIGGNSSDTPSVPIPDHADVDNLFAFARAADVKVIYTVRLRNQTDPAADVKIVQYIMDNYRGQVACFAVGNEPNIYNKDYGAYRQLISKFYAAILDAEPDARFCGPSTTPGKASWSHDFTLDFGHSGHLEFLSQHSYPGNSAKTVKDPVSGRDQMLSANFVKSYQTFFNTFGPTAAENHVPFRLEETNSYFNGGARDVSDTQASALWGLDYMYWWAAHGAIGLNFHTGDTVASADRQIPCRYALYWTSPTGYNVHPLGYAVRAFGLGQGRLVPVDVAEPADLNLTAYATLTQDPFLNVTIINKEHGAAARDATVTIAAGKGYDSGSVMFLAAPHSDIAATSGITLGESPIGDDGSWDGKWTSLPPPSADGSFVLTVPAATAAVVQFHPRSG